MSFARLQNVGHFVQVSMCQFHNGVGVANGRRWSIEKPSGYRCILSLNNTIDTDSKRLPRRYLEADNKGMQQVKCTQGYEHHMHKDMCVWCYVSWNVKIPGALSANMALTGPTLISKMWGTYPFPNFNGWEWICDFIPNFIMDVITYPHRDSNWPLLVKGPQIYMYSKQGRTNVGRNRFCRGVVVLSIRNRSNVHVQHIYQSNSFDRCKAIKPPFF